MIDLARRWWPLAFITLVALWLRTHDLARRPMHWDEANQAVKTGELLEHGHYAFDPGDHHGPTLYYVTAAVARLRGERSLAEMTETTVRLVPAVFGTIGVVLLAMIGRALTPRKVDTAAVATSDPRPDRAGPPWPALAAAAFMAVSPPAVYYARYFIQETLLVTFTLAAVVCAQAWMRDRRVAWAVTTGIFVGLMQATKEIAPLLVAFAAIAVVAAAALAGARAASDDLTVRSPETRSHSALRAIAIATVAALATAALLYSSFGTHPAGIADAVRAYTNAFARFGSEAPVTGQEKPWWYYLHLFGWFRERGLVWHQVAFSMLAAAGFGVAMARLLRRKQPMPPPDASFVIAAAVYTTLILAALSAFAYKTPWHVVHFVPGMALLAAAALVAVSNLNTGRFVAVAFALVAVGTLYQQTVRVAFLRPADERNPYAYVHSSADVLKFRPLADAALARAPDRPVWVISEEYWPLPWYFRGLPNVGYTSAVPENCDGALVITSQTTAAAVRSRLHGNYHESFLGLRPGFVCILFTPEGDEEKGNEEVRE